MQFWINSEKVNRRVSELDNIKGELGNIASGLDDIISTNVVQTDSFNYVKNVLRGYRQNVRSLSQDTAQMSAGLQDVLKEYGTHEQNIVGKASHISAKRSGSANNLMPGLPLPWSALFPSGIWTLPSVTPGWGEIGGGIAWGVRKIIGSIGYNDSSDDKFSWSLWGSSGSKHYNKNGLDVGYDGEYHVGHITLKGEVESEWDIEKGDVKTGVKAKAGFSAVDGKVSGNVGNAKGTLEGSLVNAGVEGTVGLSLFSGGKFDPSVYGKVSAKANAAKGKVSGQYGTDKFNQYVEAEGTLLGAKAEAGIQFGKIVEEKGGKKTVKTGVSCSAGAEAYLAKGSIGGGVTLFGIKFGVEVEGKAGGAGANIGGKATNDAAEGEIGLGLGLGLGLKYKVDWSEFKWPWEK